MSGEPKQFPGTRTVLYSTKLRSATHFVVGVSHGLGMVVCKRYEVMNADFFSRFIREELPGVLQRSGKPRVLLQDNDPSQTSRASREALTSIGATHFEIPARSPDLNPIENLFHLTKSSLREEAVALVLRSESVAAFEERVVRTLGNMARAHADKTIESMGKRIAEVIRRGGGRSSY